MAKVVIKTKNFSATVNHLIAAKVAGYAELSVDEAKQQLSARINEVLVNALSNDGEEKIFIPERALFVWRGTCCFVAPLSSIVGAIETLAEVDCKSCNFVEVILYSSL